MNKWSTLNLPCLKECGEHELLAPPHIHLGETPEEAFSILTLELLGNKEKRDVTTPIDTITILKKYLFHLIEKRKESRERYSKYVIPTLENPFEVWEIIDKNGTKKHHYIGLYTGKNDFMVVVIYRTDGTILWNIMHGKRKSMNSHRKGSCIYQKRQSEDCL